MILPSLSTPDFEPGEGLCDAFDRMRRQQAPHDPLFARRRVELANLDREQFDLKWRIAIGAGLRSADAKASEAHSHASLSCAAFAGPRRQVKHIPVRLR